MTTKNRPRQALRRIALGAAVAAVTVAGSLAVAAPAQAADEGQGTNCVVTVPESNVRCFDTYEQAKAFVASVAEITADTKPSSSAQRAQGDAAAGALVFWPVLLFVGYDLENYNAGNAFAGSYWVIGLNGPCTTPTTNVDYEMPTLPARWVNDISSYRDYSNCWTKLYENPVFGGSTRGYTGDSATLGGFNNITSSIRWS